MRNTWRLQRTEIWLRWQMRWGICSTFLCGTIVEHGLQHKIYEVFEEIQRSNMSKLGEDGKPVYREDGKVLKGPDYSQPDLEKILKL